MSASNPVKPSTKAKSAAKAGTKTTAAKSAAASVAHQSAAVEIFAGKAAAPPSREQIARLAERYWAERGHSHGSAEHDWLRAEQELMSQAS